MSRAAWTSLSDAQLLAQCSVDTYRASGPGGQKRNKTSSAVRLRHPPSGLIVIAEESRSQHENRAKALKRMRQALYLQIRDPVILSATLAPPPDDPDPDIAPAATDPASPTPPTAIPPAPKVTPPPEIAACLNKAGRLDLRRKDPRYWPALGVILDVLAAAQGRVSAAVQHLGISTGNLIDVLEQDPKAWEAANHLRQKFHLKLLRREKT